MSDLIDRRAAIDAANRADYTGLAVEEVKKVTDEVVKELKKLPSADLSEYCDKLWNTAYERGKAETRPKGKWRWVRMMTLTGGYDTYMCDQCEHLEKIKTNYCPNCGARMEE